MYLDKRLLREARSVRLWLGLTVAAGVGGGVLVVAQAFLVSRTIRLVFLDHSALADVRALLAGLLVVIAARSLLVWASEVSGFRAAARVMHSLRRRLFESVMGGSRVSLRRERTGDLVATATEAIEALESYFSQYLPQLLLAVLVPLLILSVVLPRDPLSGVVLLVTGPLVPAFMILIGMGADMLSRAQLQSLRLMSAHFLDVLQGLTTLKLFGRSRAQAEKIAAVSDRFRDTSLGILRVAFLSAFALEMIGTIGTAIVAVEVGLRLLYARIAFEEALFLLILAPEFYLPLRTLGLRFHAGMSGAAAAERIYAVLSEEGFHAKTQRDPEFHAKTQRPAETQRDEDEQAGARVADRSPVSAEDARRADDPGSLRLCGAFASLREMPDPFASLRETPVSSPGIRFEDVRYAYDDGERPALRGVSFEMRRGTVTAVVGPTGSGKSTVAALLLRFLEADAGQILVEGRPLADLPPDEWRRRVAWVPERPHLFHGTVADNIRLGRPEATPDEVRSAARSACAEAFIEALPEGYETPIGERGARLSAGQAQRIALARALLKNAPVVLLDEATANLDAEHEAAIQDALAGALKGRTALVIAHRLRTVRGADQIVVLNAGRVEEAGTHEALAGSGGLYARLLTGDEK